MEYFTLQTDETILFKGNATFLKKRNEVFLSNLNVYCVRKIKHFTGTETAEVQKFSISELKFYNNKPQVKHQGEEVELYFLNGEVFLTFEVKKDATKFASLAFDLASGTSGATRGMEQVKKAIGAIEDALDIDISGTMKEVVQSKTKLLFKGKKQNNTNNQVEMLKQYKELLDSGVLTQEEFEIKKKELLST